jgi:carbon storage regulator CsrA
VGRFGPPAVARKRIAIDAGITVEVIEVQGQRVRLGIEAPVEIKVLRDEPVADRETASAQGKTDDRPVDACDEGRAYEIARKLRLEDRRLQDISWRSNAASARRR